MVSKTEEEQVNRLENQVDNEGGGAWEYLCLVRKLKLRRSDKVLKHGLEILNNPKKRSALGPDEVARTVASYIATTLSFGSHHRARDVCCLKAGHVFGNLHESNDISGTCRLEAMLVEAKGSWAEAEKAYISLLEDNPFDQIILKRKAALAKAQGNISGAIEGLNKYLETFMADHDAWRELCEIYVSLQMYKQAAFCYEELILSQPTIPLYHLAYADVSGFSMLLASEFVPTAAICEILIIFLPVFLPAGGRKEFLSRTREGQTLDGLPGSAYAPVSLPSKTSLKLNVAATQLKEVLYTLGGLENIQAAKKYYASTIDLTGGKNTRALLGICLCTSAVGQLTKGRNKEDKDSPELQHLVAAALEKDYKKRAPSKLSLLSSTLRSLKLSS
ncbi:unnamed protein product [Ilex paraguariensis]|uniref:ER membrane protein complex subunit 2 n=1 Tax=Ilex paraguariensis TaxID=185542 RepID=A0ABC8QS35_9AQUA